MNTSTKHVMKGVSSGDKSMAKAIVAVKLSMSLPLNPITNAIPEQIALARSNCLGSLVLLPRKYTTGSDVSMTIMSWKPRDIPAAV